MEGKQVFKFAVQNVSSAAKTALKDNGMMASGHRQVIAHQANLRIIEAVTERLRFRIEQVLSNIDKYGNTSTASIPITLDEATRAGKLKTGDLIAMLAIGAGMAWGSALVRWSESEAACGRSCFRGRARSRWAWARRCRASPARAVFDEADDGARLRSSRALLRGARRGAEAHAQTRSPRS